MSEEVKAEGIETDALQLRIAAKELPISAVARQTVGRIRREFLSELVCAAVSNPVTYTATVGEVWGTAEKLLREGQERGHLP